METTLAATPRSETGKGWARQTRAEGLVPAVMYGPDTAPRSVKVDPDALVNLFKATQDRNTIVQVELDGATHPCLVREVQRQPLTREILHVDFYAVPQDRAIEVMVPLNPVGKPKGATLGGRIRLIRRTVKAMARFDKLPKQFDVDVTHLDIGDRLLASEIPMPDGVELVYDNDYNVIELYGKKVRGPKKGEAE
jgi:large subunit ribosomal protein L25